ncbi:lipopolysaccharide transport periplasmic protein LptA [Thiolapillus brandeum]|uniref:Lipopolysaccharide export system protein LptA n=1 Tax=Thiolapillus brandeum TaxID=1076588 RepID=A0A7U6GGV0_9GAMM|nr:lipopolysaccharide transport periplasmic protein LptA [Thiolapillus brandeum]BAO43381.1 lipopolysaccharide export system protein LptA [Thiolapillus brandeum]
MLHNNRYLLLALLLAFASAALALPSDKDAPVEIEADSADIDGATNTTTYRGKVRISQGSMELKADKVVITFKGRKPHILTATGTPAKFRQKPEQDKGWVTGQGRTIVYRINSEELVLTGNAVLTQNDDSFRSDRIVYDRVKARLKAGAAAQGSERVKVIIHPQDTP